MKIYLRDGTSLIDLEKAAKARKSEGLKLKDAYNEIAQGRGFESWQHLKENSVEIDEKAFLEDPNTEPYEAAMRARRAMSIEDAMKQLIPEYHNPLEITFRDGRDHYVVDFQFLEASEYLNQWGRLRKLWVRKDETCLFDGRIEYHVTIHMEDTLPDMDIWYQPLELDHHGSVSRLKEAALNLMNNAEPSDFLRIMDRHKLLDAISTMKVMVPEYEAELQRALRSHGRVIYDREYLNISRIDDRTVPIDLSRRCFINPLDDGTYVVSGGLPGGALIWKIKTQEEVETLIQEMLEACGADAQISGKGELWMADRVFAAA